MNKWFKYAGSGEIGDIIPGVGVISADPIQARDEAHLEAIEASGAFKSTTAPKKADADAPAPAAKGEK